jgi:MFS family permease
VTRNALRGNNALLLLGYTMIFHIGFFGIPDVVLNFYYVSLGHTPEEIALLASLPRIAGLLSGIPVGLVSNRLGERRVLVLATLGAAAALALMVAMPTVAVLVMTRFGLGFFYGAAQIVQATMMARAVRAERANLYFSVFNIVGMSCMALGNMVGGVLPTWLAGANYAETSAAYGGSLRVCAALLMVSIAPLLAVTPQGHRRQEGGAKPGTVPYRAILWLSVPMLMFGFTGGLTFPFYNLLFRATFALPDPAIGQVLGFGSLSMALVPMVNPWVARHLGSANAISGLLLIASLGFFVLGAATGARLLAVAIVAYLVAVGTRNTMQALYQPLLMSHLSDEHHNMGNSIASVVWNLGWFGATAVSGLLQTRVGYPFIMYVVGVGLVLCALSVYLIFRSQPVTQPATQT